MRVVFDPMMMSYDAWFGHESKGIFYSLSAELIKLYDVTYHYYQKILK